MSSGDGKTLDSLYRNFIGQGTSMYVNGYHSFLSLVISHLSSMAIIFITWIGTEPSDAVKLFIIGKQTTLLSQNTKVGEEEKHIHII